MLTRWLEDRGPDFTSSATTLNLPSGYLPRNLHNELPDAAKPAIAQATALTRSLITLLDPPGSMVTP